MKLFKRIFSIILVFLFTFCLLFDLSSVNAYAAMYGTVNGNELTKSEFYNEIYKYRPEEHLNQAQPSLWPSFDEASDKLLYDGRAYEDLTLMERAAAVANSMTALKDAEKLNVTSPIWQQIGKVSTELSVGNGSGQLVPSASSHAKVDPTTGLYEYELPSSGAGSAALGIGGLGAYLGGKALGVMRKDDFSSELFQQMRDDLQNEASESWTAQDYQTAIQKYMEGAGYGLLALVDDGADAGDPIFLCAEALFSEQLKALNKEKIDISKYYTDHLSDIAWNGKDTVGQYFNFDYKYLYHDPYGRGDTLYHKYRDSSLTGPLTNFRVCWLYLPNQEYYTVICYSLANKSIVTQAFNYYYEGSGYAAFNRTIESMPITFSDCNPALGRADLINFSTNVPIFNNSNQANSYVTTGKANGALNNPDPSDDPKYTACPLPVAQPEYCPQLQPYTPYTATDLLDYFDSVNEAHDAVVEDPAFNPGIDPVTLTQPITAPVAQPYPTIVKDPSSGTGTVTNPDPEVDPDPETSPSGNLINIPDWMDPDAEFGDLEADAGILKEVFPFCVPHDILLAFQTFGSSGTDTQINTQNVRIYSANKVSAAEYKPVFLFPLEFDVFGETVSYDLRIDITEGAESFIEWFKWFQVILFAFGLMKLSFKISHTF